MASANAVNIRVAFFVNKGNATCQIPITFDHAKDDRLWSSYKLEKYFGDGHRCRVELGYSYEGAREHGDVVPKPWGSAGGMKRIQDFSGFFDETTLVLCGAARAPHQGGAGQCGVGARRAD